MRLLTYLRKLLSVLITFSRKMTPKDPPSDPIKKSPNLRTRTHLSTFREQSKQISIPNFGRAAQRLHVEEDFLQERLRQNSEEQLSTIELFSGGETKKQHRDLPTTILFSKADGTIREEVVCEDVRHDAVNQEAVESTLETDQTEERAHDPADGDLATLTEKPFPEKASEPLDKDNSEADNSDPIVEDDSQLHDLRVAGMESAYEHSDMEDTLSTSTTFSEVIKTAHNSLIERRYNLEQISILRDPGDLGRQNTFLEGTLFDDPGTVVEAATTTDLSVSWKTREPSADTLPSESTVTFDHDLTGDISDVGDPALGALRAREPCPFERLVLRPEMINLGDQEIETFLVKLETDDFGEFLLLQIPKLEALFLKSLERFDYIGELPISRQFFERFVTYLKEKTESKGKPDPRHSLPALFVISMVFFARYSETDSRAFWGPYAKQVWDRDDQQYFEIVSRKLFRFARNYLMEIVGLSFDIDSQGDVVRPVYQHAIIPRYLHEPFVDWLVDHFKSLMHYPPEQLQKILETEKSLNYFYPRLKDFIRKPETREAAARLIARMTSAISLFNEVESSELVAKVLNSTLERSLWRVIYRKLTMDPSKVSVLRKISPQLTWRWSEEKGLYLHLANVRSAGAAKPDMLVWAHPEEKEIRNRDLVKIVYPWNNRMANTWELEPEDIRGRELLDGRIILLSDNYNLDKSRREQEEDIILERPVPALPDEIMYFRMNHDRNVAVLRDVIDADGSWIVFSKGEARFEDLSGQPCEVALKALPEALHSAGFTHGALFRLELPAILVSHGQQRFDKTAELVSVNPLLKGDHKLKNMSKGLPPIFSSPTILLEMNCNPDSRSFRKYILRARRNGKALDSWYLTDLKQRGWLKRRDLGCILDLTPIIADPGAYLFDLMLDLKSILDEPVQFAWLPDTVEIFEPDPATCYSRQHPLKIAIQGVPSEDIQPYDNEETKKFHFEDRVEILWPMVRGRQCRFDIYWDNHPIHFCWEVDRVAAWIVGGGDENHIFSDQEENIQMHVRGKPREKYTWFVEGLSPRDEYLNAQGELEVSLSETVLRDMLQESRLLQPSAVIRIRNDEWKLFSYIKRPSIRITNISYQNSLLQFTTARDRDLEGEYIIQVRNKEFSTSVETIYKAHSLVDEMTLPVTLVPGLYLLEIVASGEILAVSQAFRAFEQTVHPSEKADPMVVELTADRSRTLFQALTSPQPYLLTWIDDSYGLKNVLEQIEWIQKKVNRLDVPELEDPKRKLLPAWAILGCPLRFTTKTHQRVLHVFPEQALYGGQIGKGYVDLKIHEEKIRVAAYWKPSNRNDYVQLWMRIPQTLVDGKYGELDPMDLWPAYQCRGCGEVVASRNGTYLALSPSVVQAHQHGRDISVREQFLDTVYPQNEDPLEATISQSKMARLFHAYRVEETVQPGYLQSLMERIVRPEDDDMELSVPVYWQDTLDFQVAVSELYRQLDELDCKRFYTCSQGLEQASSYLEEMGDLVPPYAAASRMLEVLRERELPLSIPRYVLLLAMILRTKAYKPIRFTRLLGQTELTDNDLMVLIDAALKGCPKLLEWAVAWAELLFIHAAS